uniref:C2 domain-containing protein n=1 Tax=Hanusia phi TaxID=3032 RepID=A0A7S0E1T2_9CRYP|mmetsp:Transcript_14215/g.32733  ORF Transcript_14215/g.32733 Transcript_14215/m.32733 type:complete len:714 (+) Transcript_14215:112-2253(+)
MAFVPGFSAAEAGTRVALDGVDEDGHYTEMYRTSDEGWEAAKSEFVMTSKNEWGSPTFQHYFAIQLVECETVCWRIGVAHESFPCYDLWTWFKTLEVGEPPPWALLLAGGKSSIMAYPPSIVKSGGTEFNVKRRKPVSVAKLDPNLYFDKAGRLRLQTGDIIGVGCDMGSHNGDMVISFYVNGVLVHDPLHVFAEPEQRWVAFACLGNSKCRVKMIKNSEATWDRPELFGIKKADLSMNKGKPTFDGAGWLSIQKTFGGWERSWFVLGSDDFFYAPNPKLQVTLHRGKGLDVMDLNGYSDPYVQIRIGAEKFSSTTPDGTKKNKGEVKWNMQTSTIKYKTLEPEWQETFVLDIVDLDGWVTFSCFDKDQFTSDDLIGEFSLPLREVEAASHKASTMQKFRNQWYSINRSNSNLSSGSLQLSLMLITDAEVETQETQKKKKGKKSDKIKRFRLDEISNIKRGKLDTDFSIDYKQMLGVTTLNLRCDKPELREEWVKGLSFATKVREMGAKARTRLCETLKRPDPERAADGKPILVMDPSNDMKSGFSRVARRWKAHPLAQFFTDKQAIKFEYQCTDNDVDYIAEALKGNQWCTILRLDNLSKPGFIGDDGATRLAECLRVNTTLKELHLGGNLIKDAGATELAEALKTNSTLVKLTLDGNEITTRGCVCFVAALEGSAQTRANVTLEELSLKLNKVPHMESGRVSNCWVAGDAL